MFFFLGNPLHCDCPLTWLLEEQWRTDTNLGKCQTPCELYNKEVSSLHRCDPYLCTDEECETTQFTMDSTVATTTDDASKQCNASM